MTFAQTVKNFTSRYGMSGLCDLADHFECSVSTIRRWEKGITSPGPRNENLILEYIRSYDLCSCGQLQSDPEHRWMEGFCEDIEVDFRKNCLKITHNLKRATEVAKEMKARTERIRDRAKACAEKIRDL